VFRLSGWIYGDGRFGEGSLAVEDGSSLGSFSGRT